VNPDALRFRTLLANLMVATEYAIVARAYSLRASAFLSNAMDLVRKNASIFECGQSLFMT
jgi:hypothetical protein